MKPFLRVRRLGRADEKDFLEAVNLTPEEKLDTLQRLRELAHEISHEDRKGFQRILVVSRLKKS